MQLFELLLVFISLLVAVNAIRRYKPNELSEEKAAESIDCLADIVCKAKEHMALKRLEEATADCPDLIGEAHSYYKITYGIDNFWEQAQEIICPLSREQKMEKCLDVAQQMGADFKKNDCEHAETQKCDCYHLGITAILALVDDYTEKGVCVSKRQQMEDSDMASKNPMG